MTIFKKINSFDTDKSKNIFTIDRPWMIIHLDSLTMSVTF